MAQISEFSLILAALGLTLGHIDSQTVSLITVVGLITIGLSTYLILYSYPLYDRPDPRLGIFERRSLRPERIEVPPQVSLSLLHGIRAAGFTGPFLATAHNPVDTRLLLAAGVQVVLDPYAVAAEHSTDLIRSLATDTA